MWSYREQDLGTEFVDGIGFKDMSNLTPEKIISEMKAVCDANGIPATFEEAKFLEGGAGSIVSSLAYGQKPSLFKALKKTEFRAVKISHPNPPQSYCDQLYIILDNGVRFFFVGESKAFKEKNEYELARNGQGQGVGLKSKFRAFIGVGPDEEPYNTEMEWHTSVYSVFESMVV